MQLQDDKLYLSEKLFESIYNLLLQSFQERQQFFRNPQKVLAEKGIEFDEKSLEILKKICDFNIEFDRIDFNEKLVLCSSSGY